MSDHLPGEFRQVKQSGTSEGYRLAPVQLPEAQCTRENPEHGVAVPRSADAGAPSTLRWG